MNEVLQAALLLLLIMDPLGNVPVFLAVLKDTPEDRRVKIIWREMLIALGILLVFLFFGSHMLQALALDTEAIGIGGGIVLFLIALRMIFPPQGGIMGHHSGGEPFIVPLAIPMVAGPSTIAALLLFVRSEPGLLWHWFAALIIAWAITAGTLALSPWFYRWLKPRGLLAMERLMGMILVILSVQMLLNGIRAFIEST